MKEIAEKGKGYLVQFGLIIFALGARSLIIRNFNLNLRIIVRLNRFFGFGPTSFVLPIIFISAGAVLAIIGFATQKSEKGPEEEK